MAVFGEVGLSGEIRSVPNAQERIKEAQKNGFKTVVIPKVNQPKQPIDSMNSDCCGIFIPSLTDCF
jgi:DNA repair protein RadA/Sms